MNIPHKHIGCLCTRDGLELIWFPLYEFHRVAAQLPHRPSTHPQTSRTTYCTSCCTPLKSFVASAAPIWDRAQSSCPYLLWQPTTPQLYGEKPHSASSLEWSAAAGAGDRMAKLHPGLVCHWC